MALRKKCDPYVIQISQTLMIGNGKAAAFPPMSWRKQLSFSTARKNCSRRGWCRRWNAFRKGSCGWVWLCNGFPPDEIQCVGAKSRTNTTTKSVFLICSCSDYRGFFSYVLFKHFAQYMRLLIFTNLLQV